MKTVKIKFVGFWEDLDPNTLYIYRILKKHFDVQICDDPDYVICSCFPPRYDYCNYPAVRIMYLGENYVPDFNLVDYAICLYPISFFDRNFYLPISTDTFGRTLELETKSRNYSKIFLESKEYFANFIAGHESENGIRGSFFKKLSQYKRIESAGTYLNNMEDGFTVSWRNDSKISFQRKSKFTLCFESTKHEGFVTEKIVDAFCADTVPIYYGSSTVSEIFNPEAFIDCSSFPTFEAAIEYIKKVDNDDDLYLSIMNQPILNCPHYFSEKLSELEEFILYIFNQPLKDAYRRSRVYSPKWHEEHLILLSTLKKNGIQTNEQYLHYFSTLENNDIRTIKTKQLLRIILSRVKNRLVTWLK